MVTKKVWDYDDVYSLTGLLRTPLISEAMLGRAFQILGVKGEELGKELQVWKGRIVFQGRTSGRNLGRRRLIYLRRCPTHPHLLQLLEGIRRCCVEGLQGYASRR